MSNAENQCAPGQLWYPGLHLDEEFPVPTDTELCEMWQGYDTDAACIRPLAGVYGVYRTPTVPVRAIASIDLCEVVRETVVGLEAALNLETGKTGSYSQGTWYDAAVSSYDYERSVVISTVRALMHNGHVQPMKDIRDIRSILKNWRKNDVYCAANTSTLPGCEVGTITHTLGRDMPGCFDALVLPRNHDGTGAITKAIALGILATEAQLPIHDVPIVHIDDAPHHIEGFMKEYPAHTAARFFAPLHRDNHSLAPVEVHAESPLAAFEAANDHFRELGVLS